MGFFDGIGGIVSAINPTMVLGTGAQMGASLLNYDSQQKTNKANADQAQAQMDFQRDMSNTAHQREVDDLTKAGLNPTLSAGGNGSSTPTGAAATMQAPQISMPDIFSYGVSMKQLEQAQQKIDIEDRNSKAAIAKGLTESELTKVKKLLLEKGYDKADIQSKPWKLLNELLKTMSDQVKKPSLRTPSINKGQNFLRNTKNYLEYDDSKLQQNAIP